MSYKITEKWVKRLVADEYVMASVEHGKLFASPHEGYAVLREEIEEAAEEMDSIDWHSNYMWRSVKNDDSEGCEDAARIILRRSVRLACEAIQVAAMAIKMLWSLKHKEEKKCR